MTLVGVISDTHGLLRPEVFAAFNGVDLILHAGDIGKPDILESLKSLAPVLAIRGNNDTDAWARKIPETRIVPVGEFRVYLLHDIKELKHAPGECHAVVSGHSQGPRLKSAAASFMSIPEARDRAVSSCRSLWLG